MADLYIIHLEDFLNIIWKSFMSMGSGYEVCVHLVPNTIYLQNWKLRTFSQAKQKGPPQTNFTLSELLAHSTVDHHLKEVIVDLDCDVMKQN